MHSVTRRLTHLVPDEDHDHGGDVLVDVRGRVEGEEPLELLGELEAEAPVALVVHLEEVGQLGQVLPPRRHVQQAKEVAQVLQHADPNLEEVNWLSKWWMTIQVGK